MERWTGRRMERRRIRGEEMKEGKRGRRIGRGKEGEERSEVGEKVVEGFANVKVQVKLRFAGLRKKRVYE